jgi:tRNA modification GTPase
MEDADTICAISTPPGEGGIGIIRISGNKAHSILKQVFRPGKHRGSLLPRMLYLGNIVEPGDNTVLDEVLAVFMSTPQTYTREDTVEIYAHGGFVAQKNILSLIIRSGARLAEPGEFTKRAFLNGRIDLLQAESVLDIIQSETDEEFQCAFNYLKGAISKKIHAMQNTVRTTLANTEALIDFPEEDVDVDEKEFLPVLKKIKKDMEVLIGSYEEGRAVKQGLDVLIAGKTNVGKSSLLNALLVKERAIVTPLPGTTRDMIEDTIYIKGIKVKIIDTAGIRTPSDIIEQEGIARVKRKISETDLIIWVLDGSEAYSKEDDEVYREIRGSHFIVALNKIDLPQKIDKGELASKGLQWVEISALQDVGLERLKGSVYAKLMGSSRRTGKTLITNIRHKNALAGAKGNIERAIECMENRESLEFIAFELREALHHLGEITGETFTDDILHEIFEKFCIGK